MKREFLRMGSLVAIGTSLACAGDSTGVVTAPSRHARVFTSLEVGGSGSPMALIFGLDEMRLTVRAKDQDGVPMLVERGSFSIASDNPAVATVGVARFWMDGFNDVPYGSYHDAYITAVAPGEAVILVSWTIGGVTRTASSTVRVESTEGWSLKADPANLTVKLGSAKPVQVVIVDATGKTRVLAASVFTSDRTDVATVYYDEICLVMQPCSDVNIRGVGLGEATVTARFEGFSARIRVTVAP